MRKLFYSPLIYFLIFFIIISLISCTKTISKNEAERRANLFILQAVKPYAGIQENQINDYNVSIINSSKEDNIWVVNVRISAVTNGTVLKNDIQVSINALDGSFAGITGKGVQEFKK